MERSGKPPPVNADEPPPQSDPYRCPGEQHPISRAVHLGRLAAFYPACRQCPRRDETGTLSPRRVAQLAETSRRGQPRSLFHDEGAGGVYLNDLTPAAAKEIAAAFAAVMRDGAGEGREGERGDGETRRETGTFVLSVLVSPSPPLPLSSVLLAGDGRPLTAELVAAAAEGLRSTGCNVVDIGPSTAPCLAFAVHHLQAAGGVSGRQSGRRFAHRGHEVLGRRSAAALRPADRSNRSSNAIEAGVERRPPATTANCAASRPIGRTWPKWRNTTMRLRPLRVVVDSASRPTLDFLQRLAATVACEIIPSRSTRNDLPRQIRADAAHFAACIDGDGETCRVLDEQGRPVPPERLLLLLAAEMPEATPVAEAVGQCLETGDVTPAAESDRLLQHSECRSSRAALAGPTWPPPCANTAPRWAAGPAADSGTPTPACRLRRPDDRHPAADRAQPQRRAALAGSRPRRPVRVE